MKAQRPLRVGIIGAGRIGRLHAEHLVRRITGAELVAIADINRQAAEEAGANLGISTALDRPEAIFEDANMDAVLICSSTDTHARFIQQAAAAGKHVFCEKPIDFDLGRIEETLRAVQEAGVKFQVGFNRRFDADFLKIKEVVSRGQIGMPHILRITSRDPEPPPLEYLKASGGLFLDMTIHDFDMARFLMGREIVEVYATGEVLIDERFHEAGDVDTAVLTLRFEDGALGSIDNSRRAAYGYDQRVEVFGSKGMVRNANNKPDTHTLLTADGEHSPPPWYFFLQRYKESYAVELQAFVDAIRENTEPPVTGHDGLVPVKLALAAKKSLHEARPVRIEEIG